MLTIRLSRTGKKNKPYFRVIVIEKSAAAQSGKFLEIVGNYDPHQKKGVFKEERIKYWLSCGAQASDTVHNLLVKNGIIQEAKRKKKISVKKKSQPVEAENVKEEVVEEKEKVAEEQAEEESAEEEPAVEEKEKQEPAKEESEAKEEN